MVLLGTYKLSSFPLLPYPYHIATTVAIVQLIAEITSCVISVKSNEKLDVEGCLFF